MNTTITHKRENRENKKIRINIKKITFKRNMQENGIIIARNVQEEWIESGDKKYTTVRK